MYKMLNYWILQAIGMWLTTIIIPRLRITGVSGAFLIVIALAMVNATIWDAALFFSIPDMFTAHAMTILLANGVVFWVLVKILPGIEVDGILPAIAAPVVFTLVSLFVNEYLKDVDWIVLGKTAIESLAGLRDELLKTENAISS